MSDLRTITEAAAVGGMVGEAIDDVVDEAMSGLADAADTAVAATGGVLARGAVKMMDDRSRTKTIVILILVAAGVAMLIRHKQSSDASDPVAPSTGQGPSGPTDWATGDKPAEAANG